MFDPDPNKFDALLDAPMAHYLGCQPAKDAEKVVTVLSIRFAPAVSFGCWTFSLSKEQTVRLRDDLHSLLTTPGSWLCSPSQEPPAA